MDSAKKMDSIKNRHSRRRLVDDLLLEILLRVPTKSLIRFKCVSKAWCSLTSDLCYQKSLPSTMHGIFYQACTRSNSQRFKWSINYLPIIDDGMIETTLSFSFLPFSDKLRIIDCCNGLLLCSSGAVPEIFYVCNPVTKKYLALPKPRRSRICPKLAFDPRVSPHFRVIHFYRNESLVRMVEVFSSETGEWVEREMCWEPHVKLFSHRQHVFLGRNLHMLASSKLSIVGYNLKENSCRSFQLPEPASVSSKQSLGQSGGYLHFIHRGKDQLRIWMLKDYDSNGWVLKHRINVQEIAEQHNFSVPISSVTLHLFAFHPESDDVFLWLGDSLYSYHFTSSKLEKVCSLGYTNPTWLFPYSPCLTDWAYTP